MAAGFILAGMLHFRYLAAYVQIVPPWLPAPGLLVQISGVCEIAGGAGLLFAPVRRIAVVGLIALLAAVFPANLHMALHPGLYARWAPAVALYARLPLQGVLAAWIWWARGWGGTSGKRAP